MAYCDGTIQNCTISDNSGSGLERCGGTIKNNELWLQGEHKEKLKELLVEEGFKKEQIEIK